MFKLKFGLPWKKKEKKDLTPLSKSNIFLPPRKRELKKKRLSKRKLMVLLLPFFILVLLALIFFLAKNRLSFFVSNPFKFQQISISSPNLSCVNNNQVTRDPELIKYNFFNLNQKEIEQKLKQKYLCIGKVTVNKNFPSKLILSLSPKKPVAQIKTYILSEVNLDLSEATPSSQEARLLTDPTTAASSSGIFLADDQGVLFDLSTENIQGLPIINYYNEQPLNLGSKLTVDSMEKTLQTLAKFNQLSLPVEQIQIIEDSLIIKGSPEVKLAFKKDLSRQLISLQLILQKSTIDLVTVKSVDLRFDKPVVVYSAKK